jgi:hypothetical protein
MSIMQNKKSIGSLSLSSPLRQVSVAAHREAHTQITWAALEKLSPSIFTTRPAAEHPRLTASGAKMTTPVRRRGHNSTFGPPFRTYLLLRMRRTMRTLLGLGALQL